MTYEIEPRILFCNVFLGGRNYDCNQKNTVALLHFTLVKIESTNQQYDKRLFIELPVDCSVHENCKVTAQNILGTCCVQKLF